MSSGKREFGALGRFCLKCCEGIGVTLCAEKSKCDRRLLPANASEEIEVDYIEVNEETVIEYFTDIEGSWDYLIRFVDKSKVLRWDGEDQGAWGPGTLKMDENGLLVFGGDAPDKGPGDIRIVITLTNLKRRYPSQVFFVLGNRDLMKLRFYAELQDVEPPGQIWMPTWDKKAKPFDTYIEESKEPNRIKRDLIGKLKWLLHCTMGCQDTTFGTRKRELALLLGSAKDEAVLDSYLSSVDPKSRDPWMLDFIRMAQIGLVLGDTLFVHGGVQEESIGRVPGQDGMCNSVQEWVEKLNLWKDAELEAYIQHPSFYWKDGVQTRGGAKLIEYGTPGAGKSTVIYYNPFQDGNPVQRTPTVQDYLERSNIMRVISGHQPHGQTPTVVRHPNTGLLVITADTSRSDGQACKLFNPADNRGAAISVVRLQGSATILEGELLDGRQHRCTLNCNPALDKLPDALVGRQLDDGSWVKSVMADEDSHNLYIALGKGYNVKASEITEHSACLRLRQEYRNNPMFHVSLSDFKADASDTSSTIEDCRDSFLASHAKQVVSLTFDKEEFHSADNYIFSLMGVVPDPETAAGKEIVSKINTLIDKGKRVIFITNNSNHSCFGLRLELEDKYGINLSQTKLSSEISNDFSKGNLKDKKHCTEISKQHVVTSAQTCAWFLKRTGIKKPFVICSSKALLEEMEKFDITNYVATTDQDGKAKPEYLQEITEQRVCSLISSAPDVDAIVVGWDQGFTALKAAVATQYVKWWQEREEGVNFMPIISCSMDSSGILGSTGADFCKVQHFDRKKIRAIGNGAMTKVITNTTTELDEHVIDVGKPSIILLEQLKRPPVEHGLGLDFSKTIVVGSTLETDIELANGGGMKSLLVLTGVTKRKDVEREMNPLRIPTWVTESLADI